MRGNQINKLIRQHLLSEFPGFTSTKTGEMLRIPMNHLWRGFAFEGSSYSKSTFRVYVVVMPLYLPAEEIHLTFGERLRFGGNEDSLEWDATKIPDLVAKITHAMKTKGMDFLNRASSPLEFGWVPWSLPGLKSQEVIAYSLIYAGEFIEAALKMESLCRDISRCKTDVPWTIEWFRQIAEMDELLKRSPESAQAQLVEWEKQTIINLKLESYPN